LSFLTASDEFVLESLAVVGWTISTSVDGVSSDSRRRLLADIVAMTMAEVGDLVFLHTLLRRFEREDAGGRPPLSLLTFGSA